MTYFTHICSDDYELRPLLNIADAEPQKVVLLKQETTNNTQPTTEKDTTDNQEKNTQPLSVQICTENRPKSGNIDAEARNEGKTRFALCVENDENPALTALRGGAKPAVPYVKVPKVLRESAIEYAPILENEPCLMALFQCLLFGQQRDESTGQLVIPYAVVFHSFGIDSTCRRDSYRKDNPITANAILTIYRDLVDPAFTASGYHSSGHARTVTSHSIPDRIFEIKEQFMEDPGYYDDYVYLIDGSAANRSNLINRRKRRENEAKEHEPLIQPPAYISRTRRYLNGLSHRFGKWNDIQQAVPVATKEVRELRCVFNSEGKRDSATNALAVIRDYPKPLYLASDYSPRLKADPYNQLMNLKRELRPSFYDEKDVELDLSKAHLACFVKVAESVELAMPVTKQYLRAHLSGEIDLWEEIAGSFNLKLTAATRKAAKRIYAIAYGSSDTEALRQIYNRHAEVSGDPADGFESFHPVLQHPMIKELREVRTKLLEKIEDSGGFEDAAARFIPLYRFEHKKPENRSKSVLAYVNASYEQLLISAAFDEAIAEEKWAKKKDSRRVRFRIWLYQADGFTVRVTRKRDRKRMIKRLQDAVAEKAQELGILTRLEVE